MAKTRERQALGRILAALAAAGAVVVPQPVAGQQFIVDDAPVVDFRACQLEAWHGRLAGWLLPACQPVRRLELTAGVGWIRDFEDGWDLDVVLQGKYELRQLEPDGAGWSLVAGAGLGPLAQAIGRRFHQLFVYVPVSVSRFDDRLLVHLNVGWSMERAEHGAGEDARTRTDHHITWGARGDVVLTHRFALIGEVFGEDGATPEYQVGLRSTLVPDRLLLDVSYGDRLGNGIATERIGLVVGLAWTPPPFL